VKARPKFQAHQGLSGFERIAPEWATLAASIANVGFNQLPSWYRAYLASGRCDPATIWFITARWDDRELAGVFPLQLHGRYVAVLGARLLGTINDNELQLSDFTFAQTARNAHLVYELTRWLRRQRTLGWDQLRIVKIADNSSAAFAARAKLPSKTVAEIYDGSAYFDVSGTYEQATRAMSNKFRSNLRRRTKLAESTAKLRFQSFQRPEDIEAGFRIFLDVESSGWKGPEGTASSIGCTPQMRAFYAELVREFGPRNECIINVLWHGEHAIAGQFGLRIGRTLHMMKVGYRDADALLAPGILLHSMTIRHACEDPGTDVLSLVNDPPWAHSFKPMSMPVWLYRTPNWTLQGLLAHAGLLMRRKWKPRGSPAASPTAEQSATTGGEGTDIPAKCSDLAKDSHSMG
jgi:CelD/BcsL family acetyltransferase involved in cellulose biosynthesis